MLDVVARARELDGLASPLDAQLTVTLRANSVAWSVGYVQQCAARQGFVPGALPGRWCCRRPRRARRRCWCCPSTRRPRWPTTRRPQAAVREVHAERWTCRRRPSRRAARAAAPPRPPLLRARRPGDPDAEYDRLFHRTAGAGGRAPRAAHARLAHAARDRPGARRLHAGAPRRADAQHPHRDRHHRRAAPAPSMPACAASWSWPTTRRRWPTPPS
jgi:hypothetical protein